MLFNPVPSTLDCAEFRAANRQNANKETTMSRMKLRVAIPVLLIGLFSAAVVQAQVTKKQLDAVRANFKVRISVNPEDSVEQKRISTIPGLGSLGA